MIGFLPPTTTIHPMSCLIIQPKGGMLRVRHIPCPAPDVARYRSYESKAGFRLFLIFLFAVSFIEIQYNFRCKILFSPINSFYFLV